MEEKILSIEQLKNTPINEILSLYRRGYRIGHEIESLQCPTLTSVSLTGNNSVCPITVVSPGSVAWSVDWAGGQPPYRIILYIDGSTVGFYQTGQVPTVTLSYWSGTVGTQSQGTDWTIGSHVVQAQVIDSCTPTAQVALSPLCNITVTAGAPTCTTVIGGLILSGGKYYQCYADIKHGVAPNTSDVSYLCGIGVTNEAQLQQWITATEQQQGIAYPSCTAVAPPPTITPPPVTTPPPTTPPPTATPPPTQYYSCIGTVCQPSTTCPIGNCFTTNNCNFACTGATPPPSQAGGCTPACNTATEICFLGLSCVQKKYITYGALGLGAILVISIIK